VESSMELNSEWPDVRVPSLWHGLRTRLDQNSNLFIPVISGAADLLSH
jgi:hypothetical protein